MAVEKISWDETKVISQHFPLGISTGFLWDMRGDWEAQVEFAASFNSAAAELSALSEDELPELVAFLSDRSRLPFRYLSVHGPSKDRELSEKLLVERLLELESRCDAIVMHPDTMRNFVEYSPLGGMLLIENMDSRKRWGRYVEELAEAFEQLPAAGFCFDIAHAWSMDHDMHLAHELLDAFGDRLRHVHLSSLSVDLHHESLTVEDEERFAPVLRRCNDVPWILEAPPRA